MNRPARSFRVRALAALVAAAVIPSGCERAPSAAPSPAPPDPAASAPTNRVDIGPAVRRNLGITFATVEERNVARTLRVPGRFELLPTARREYRAPVAGRVELLVEQYQRVEPGTPLYRIDSPRWHELRRELTDAGAQIVRARAGVDSIGPFMEAHERHHGEIQKAIDLWEARVVRLEALAAAGGVGSADVTEAKAALVAARSQLAETLEKEAELVARRSEADADLAAASAREAILVQSAASLAGRTPAELLAAIDGRPAWQTMDRLEVRADAPGVIDSLHAVSGGVVEQHEAVLETVQPDRVRFRATALQSDLGRLADGLAATVVAPQGGSLSGTAGGAEALSGTLTLAPTADAERRTIELVMAPGPGQSVPPWARAGVSAFLEVVVKGTQRPELAIPLACVARDGAQSIIFRRDPGNPDQAIRMEADLGIDDGRWVVVRSGVAEGDEIVLDGVYQLMVATSGSITKGGHFHSDGTFHEGED